MKIRILPSLLSLSLVAAPVAAQSPAQPAMAEIQRAYSQTNFADLERHLNETVVFDGEEEVIADQVRGNLVMHDPNAVRRPPISAGSGSMSATVSGESLVASYERLIAKIGRDRLAPVLGSLTWRQVQTDRDGYPYREAKAGDWILYTHLRSDEGPEVLDEAVIFVLRDQGSGHRVVAHLADY